MTSKPRPTRLVPALIAFALILGGAPAISTPRPESTGSLERIREATAGRFDGRFAPETRAFSFLRATGSRPLLDDGGRGRPAERAFRFLATIGDLLGMTEAERAAPEQVLLVRKAHTDLAGKTHVRLDQRFRELEVFGGRLVVHMDRSGITGVSGYFVPGAPANVRPRLSEARARRDAVRSTAAALEHHGRLRAGPARLRIFRTGLAEGRYGRTALAYEVEVSGTGVREQAWIDAHSGTVLARLPLEGHARDRCVYSPRYDHRNPEMFALRREGQPPTLVPHVDNLYEFTGQVYDLFAESFGRDSYDGVGQRMRTVSLVNSVCPNAYWDGRSTNYCPGFELDDIVGHEWGHAFTEHTHGLIYAWQPGALNESYSDIWGEVIDLLNDVDGFGGANNDEPYPNGQRWLVGEDFGPTRAHALLFRDMWNPERMGDPGRVSSGNYHCSTTDAGGVHTNSGVPNHAFAMLVDGKTYRGTTVEGIGLTKAAHIYYQAMRSYQTPVSKFADHDQALKASCADLQGVPLPGLGAWTPAGETITEQDCEQVSSAMVAVQMSAPPKLCGFEPLLAKSPPPICEGADVLFREDWEGGLHAWSHSSTGRTSDWPGLHWEHRSTLPGERAGTAAFAIDPPDGACDEAGPDYSGQFTMDTPPIAVSGSGRALMLRFDHWVATQRGYDGGNVKVSVNGGPFALLPQEAYRYNAPPSQLANALDAPEVGGHNSNPKAGEFAWHGGDGGEVTGSWGTTVADLSGLVSAGDNVRVRFDFGINCRRGWTGWYVDDVVVYACPPASPRAEGFRRGGMVRYTR